MLFWLILDLHCVFVAAFDQSSLLYFSLTSSCDRFARTTSKVSKCQNNLNNNHPQKIRRKDHLVDVKLSFEEISKGVRHFFERADEGGKKPSLRYWKSLPGVKAAFESGDPSYFWSRSEDGGLTCPFLEPGTKAILSHDRVVDEFRSFGQRWASGRLLPDFNFTSKSQITSKTRTTR